MSSTNRGRKRRPRPKAGAYYTTIQPNEVPLPFRVATRSLTYWWLAARGPYEHRALASALGSICTQRTRTPARETLEGHDSRDAERVAVVKLDRLWRGLPWE